MARLFVFTLFFTAVAAFAPKANNVIKSASALMERMVGGSVEVKTLFPNNFKDSDSVYDPLDLMKLYDVNPDLLPHPLYLRESELKHGRICMLASIGAFVPQKGFVIPGFEATADPFENLQNFFTQHPEGFAQIILAIGATEGAANAYQFYNPNGFWSKGNLREVGRFHYDPTGFWDKQTQAQKDTLLLKELKNGRLAMIAMLAYAHERVIPGSVPLQYLLGQF